MQEYYEKNRLGSPRAGGHSWLPWILLALWLVAAGPREGVLALGLVLAGAWMLANRALIALPGPVWALCGIWLAGSALQFLPGDFGQVAAWRAELGAGGRHNIGGGRHAAGSGAAVSASMLGRCGSP